MAGLFKNIVQFLTKPIFTALFLCGTLVVFLFHAFNYSFIVDDYIKLAVTQKHDFIESIQFLFTYLNGRWFSHVLMSLVFGGFGCKAHLYWIAQLLQVILFTLSVSFFFRSIFKLKILQSLHSGTFFTCVLYWFCFDGRVEIWYWEASCLVHLVCMICIFLLYGLVFRNGNATPLQLIFISLLSLFIGGLSETFALACILVSLYLIIRNRSLILPHVLILIFIGVSLMINHFSPGTNFRKHNLPDQEISLGIKNTIYSFYLQLAKLKYLPFRAAGLFLLWPLALLIRNYSSIYLTLTKIDYLIIGAVILENTFIPAYLISFETPDRIFVLNWILFLLLLLNYMLKKKSTELTSS